MADPQMSDVLIHSVSVLGNLRYRVRRFNSDSHQIFKKLLFYRAFIEFCVIINKYRSDSASVTVH